MALATSSPLALSARAARGSSSFTFSASAARVLLPLFCVLASVIAALAQGPTNPPFQVKIQDDKPASAEPIYALDPVQHLQLTGGGAMSYNFRVDNQAMYLESMYNWFSIDEKISYPGSDNTGRFLAQNQPLPKAGGDKPRIGYRSVWERGSLLVTEDIEVVATRGKAGGKRRLDAVVVRFTIENKGKESHRFGIRGHLNAMAINNNRGALFAAPGQPTKVLDGVELKGDKVPEYLQIVEKADPRDPGLICHLTCNLGGGYEKPTRVILTRGGNVSADKWDPNILPAAGNTGLCVFFDPKEVKPGTTRRMAYAFGQGIAPHIDGDGLIAVTLGGSFEPGKLFTVVAQVADPSAGQHLTLELPPGMQLLEGKERQPVPGLDEEGNTLVLWKARVMHPGQFHLRVHSSTGITQTKIITISRPGEP